MSAVLQTFSYLPVYAPVQGSSTYAILLGKKGMKHLVILVGDNLLYLQMYQRTFSDRWRGPISSFLEVGDQYTQKIRAFRTEFLNYLKEKGISRSQLIEPYFEDNWSEGKIQEIIERTEQALGGRIPYRRQDDMPGLNLPVCW